MNETYDVNGDTVPRSEHYTPNVNIENPKLRRIVNATLQTATIIVAAIMAGDAISPHIDWTPVTLPVAAVIGALAGGYGLSVTQPNIPKR